jgi:hypothetical protein
MQWKADNKKCMKCALKKKSKITKWKECKEKSTSSVVRSAH